MPLLKRVNFNEILTFDRNTDKTGFVLQSDGFGNQVPTLKTFAPNEPAKVIVDPLTKERLGISIHGQRTNLLSNSVFSGAQSDPVTPPNGWSYGTTNGDFLVTEDSIFSGAKRIEFSSDNSRNFMASGVTVTSGQQYIFSARVTVLQPAPFVDFMQIFGAGATFFINGEEVPSSEILPVGTHFLSVKRVADSGTEVVRLGSGCAVNRTGRAIFDVPQFEQGSFATPYIPTSGTAVTRLADNCRILDIDQSDWFNPNEGTFVVELNVPNSSAQDPNVLFSVGRGNDRIMVQLVNGLALVVQTPTQASISTRPLGGTIYADVLKLAISYGNDTVSASFNGSSVSNLTGRDSLFTSSELFLGVLLRSWNNANHSNGTCKSAVYYPYAMTPEQLQSASQLGGS